MQSNEHVFFFVYRQTILSDTLSVLENRRKLLRTSIYISTVKAGVRKWKIIKIEVHVQSLGRGQDQDHDQDRGVFEAAEEIGGDRGAQTMVTSTRRRRITGESASGRPAWSRIGRQAGTPPSCASRQTTTCTYWTRTRT